MEDQETGSPVLETKEEVGDEIVEMFCLCRMCAKDTSEDASSCPFLPTSVLANTLREFFSINVKENDHLPKQICLSCLQSVNQWREVKDKVCKSQKFYERQLKLRRQNLDSKVIDLNDEDSSEEITQGEILSENNPEQKITVTVDPDLLLNDFDICRFSCSRCLKTFNNFDELIAHKADHLMEPKEIIKPLKPLINKSIISNVNDVNLNDTEPINFDASEILYDSDSSDMEISKVDDNDDITYESDASTVSNTELVPCSLQPNFNKTSIEKKCKKEILSIKAQKVLMPNFIPILPKGSNLENFITVKTSVSNTMKTTIQQNKTIIPQAILPKGQKSYLYQPNILQGLPKDSNVIIESVDKKGKIKSSKPAIFSKRPAILPSRKSESPPAKMKLMKLMSL